jgi:hypothetical protein
MKSLAREFDRHYKDEDPKMESGEINSALRKIGQATEKFFESLDQATNDPEIRASKKQAARSFGAALSGTFREIGEELDKALKQPSTAK